MKVSNNPNPASIPGGKLILIFKFSSDPSHGLIFNVSCEYKIKKVSSSFSFGFLTSAVLENSITSVLLFLLILFIITFLMTILCSFIAWYWLPKSDTVSICMLFSWNRKVWNVCYAHQISILMKSWYNTVLSIIKLTRAISFSKNLFNLKNILRYSDIPLSVWGVMIS